MKKLTKKQFEKEYSKMQEDFCKNTLEDVKNAITVDDLKKCKSLKEIYEKYACKYVYIDSTNELIFIDMTRKYQKGGILNYIALNNFRILLERLNLATEYVER